MIGQDKNNVESVSNEISENIDLIPILCEENNILKTKIQQLEVSSDQSENYLISDWLTNDILGWLEDIGLGSSKVGRCKKAWNRWSLSSHR